jgi:thiol-disulfide isomerase/thioredoxin/uncharacterized protein (DUF2147 family)
MHTKQIRAALAACACFALSHAVAQAAEPVPEAGRWLTESGALEVEIAPCGKAYCGTVTRVLSNASMAGPGAPAAGGAAPSPLGKTIIRDLQPLPDKGAGAGWQGWIVNRENGRDYHVRLAALEGDRLQLTIYTKAPGDGRVQVWRRPAADAAVLQDIGPAPEFAGIERWHNSPALSMAALRGKVVLVDFWTSSCINCIHTLPYVRQWYAKYADRGLVVVGVHPPEFPEEQDARKVAAAIARYHLSYPVAQDNGYATWRNYGNQYWPAFYLVDRHGRIRARRAGEGGYAETDAAIRQLLDEPAAR